MNQPEAAARWCGLELSQQQIDALSEYAEWLVAEAIPAGGLGPREASRIWDRHIADSLVFATAWRDVEVPHELLDIGSGVGLPESPWPSRGPSVASPCSIGPVAAPAS